jgi:hypothetical protein
MGIREVINDQMERQGVTVSGLARYLAAADGTNHENKRSQLAKYLNGGQDIYGASLGDVLEALGIQLVGGKIKPGLKKVLEEAEDRRDDYSFKRRYGTRRGPKSRQS